MEQGDPSALHFLYVRHADDLRAYLEAIVHDPDAADRIVHDVFADLMSAIFESGERPFPLAAAVLRSATNMALEHLHTRTVVPEAVFASVGSQRRPAQLLGHALKELSSDQRDVLVLRQAAGLSAAQTAAVLGRDERAVERLHERARARLRAALESGPAGVAAEA